jgi:succinate dehydrogenase / fumarate reductase flavoprotein subunit
MQEQVGIFRDAAGLSAALSTLEELERRARSVGVASAGRAYNPGWHLCRDLRNMLICAEAITRAALRREESRGAHSRLDFPDYDDEHWGLHNIALTRAPDGTMNVEPTPVVTVAELAGLVERRKEEEAAR